MTRQKTCVDIDMFTNFKNFNLEITMNEIPINKANIQILSNFFFNGGRAKV